MLPRAVYIVSQPRAACGLPLMAPLLRQLRALALRQATTTRTFSSRGSGSGSGAAVIDLDDSDFVSGSTPGSRSPPNQHAGGDARQVWVYNEDAHAPANSTPRRSSAPAFRREGSSSSSGSYKHSSGSGGGDVSRYASRGGSWADAEPRRRWDGAAAAGRPSSRRHEAAYNRGDSRSWRTEHDAPVRPNPAHDAEDVVFGIHPVACALRARSRTIQRAYIMDAADMSFDAEATAGRDSALGAIRQALVQAGIHPTPVSRDELHKLSKNQVHQGVVLHTHQLDLPLLDSMQGAPDMGEFASHPVATYAPRTRAPVWLALDEIVDPHNLGAILRSAWLLGAEGVLLSQRNSAPITGVVSKTSSGALELLAAAGRLHTVPQLPALLTGAAASGWRVLGADKPPLHVLFPELARTPVRGSAEQQDEDDGVGVGHGAGASASAPAVTAVGASPDAASVIARPKRKTWVSSAELRGDVPTILVMGNEGRGMRTLVMRACNAFVYVPQAAELARAAAHDDGAPEVATDGHDSPLPSLESLNVSVAASILLHQLRHAPL